MIPYKDDNPSRTFPIITILLIALNFGVWFFFRMQGEVVYQRAVFELGMIPYGILHGTHMSFANFMEHYYHYRGAIPSYPHEINPYLTMLTSMFMHGGLMHLGGNMLFLWIFGNNIEDYLGHPRFTIFYIICGLGAALTHLFFNPTSQVPTVGASGAISGILAAYLLLYPRARVHVLIPIFFFITTATIPAWFMIIFWFIFQVLATTAGSSPEGAGVAYWAHIGGFALGFVYIFFRRLIRPPRRPLYRYR